MKFPVGQAVSYRSSRSGKLFHGRVCEFHPPSTHFVYFEAAGTQLPIAGKRLRESRESVAQCPERVSPHSSNKSLGSGRETTEPMSVEELDEIFSQY